MDINESQGGIPDGNVLEGTMGTPCYPVLGDALVGGCVADCMHEMAALQEGGADISMANLGGRHYGNSAIRDQTALNIFPHALSAPPDVGPINASTLFAFPPTDIHNSSLFVGRQQKDEVYAMYKRTVQPNPAMVRPFDDVFNENKPRVPESRNKLTPPGCDGTSRWAVAAEQRQDLPAAAAVVLSQSGSDSRTAERSASTPDMRRLLESHAATLLRASRAFEKNNGLAETSISTNWALQQPTRQVAARAETTTTRATSSGSSTGHAERQAKEAEKEWNQPISSHPNDFIKAACLEEKGRIGELSVSGLTRAYVNIQEATGSEDTLNHSLHNKRVPNINASFSGSQLPITAIATPPGVVPFGDVEGESEDIQRRKLLAAKHAAAAVLLLEGGIQQPSLASWLDPNLPDTETWAQSSTSDWLRAVLLLTGGDSDLQNSTVLQNSPAQQIDDEMAHSNGLPMRYNASSGSIQRDWKGFNYNSRSCHSSSKPTSRVRRNSCCQLKEHLEAAATARRRSRLADTHLFLRGSSTTNNSILLAPGGCIPTHTIADNEALLAKARDQSGCRLLQRRLTDGSCEDRDRIFEVAFDHLVTLMKDAYGNYLIQKLVEVCSDDQLRRLLHAVTPRLQEVCCDPHGTRTIQKLIDVICGTHQHASMVTLLVRPFRPLVYTLATDPNGNHVLQRFLSCSRNPHSICNASFILQAARDNCLRIATERHGCCVIQRCCDAATGFLKEQLLGELIRNALQLVQDPFGNYVIQHILRTEYERVGVAITTQIRGFIHQLSEQKFASNVIEMCLLIGDAGQRYHLINELLMDHQQLQYLVLHAYGNYVVQRALDVAVGEHKHTLLDIVRRALTRQNCCHHNNRIAQKLLRKFPEIQQSNNGTAIATRGITNI